MFRHIMKWLDCSLCSSFFLTYQAAGRCLPFIVLVRCGIDLISSPIIVA